MGNFLSARSQEMGKIREEKVQSFNLPMYIPTIKEMGAIIEKNGSFKIERSEALANPNVRSRDVTFAVSMTRAITEEVIEKHFGEEIIEELFKLHTKKLQENYLTAFDNKHPLYVHFIVVLKRKLD